MDNKLKLNRYIDLFLSSYLIIAGLSCFVIVTNIVIRLGLIGGISVLWLVASLFLIALSLFNNYNILRGSGDLRKSYLINLWICLPQTIVFFFDNFHFKYTQGLELVGAMKITNSDSVWMSFPLNFTHEVIFNFLGSSFTLIGINLISLILAMYYSFRIKIIR